MNHHIRKDIVLEKVSGVYVLVALRSAWKECPFAMQTIPVYAEIWKQLGDGKTDEEIIRHLILVRGFSKERAEKIFGKFIESAAENHYLIEEDAVQ